MENLLTEESFSRQGNNSNPNIEHARTILHDEINQESGRTPTPNRHPQRNK